MWGTSRDGDNIVWGTDCGGADCDNIVWGTGMATLHNIVWGTARVDGDNIVWGTARDGDNIVWGTSADTDNIVWGCSAGEDAPIYDDPDNPAVYDGISFDSLFGDGTSLPGSTGTTTGTETTTIMSTGTTLSEYDDVGAGGRGAVMEKMPFQAAQAVTDLEAVIAAARSTAVATSDWRKALPVLTGSMVTLRELRLSDAPSLFAMLTTEEVARFISPPPTTVEGFERFIAWTHRQRAAGSYICFAVVPHGMDTAIGIFQVRQLEPGFATAEWGFAIGSAFWGTGVFLDGAAAGDRVRVRDGRRAPARSAGGGRERPRQRRAAEDRRGSGRACCASRSSETASISTRRSGPCWTRTGGRCARCAPSKCTSARVAGVNGKWRMPNAEGANAEGANAESVNAESVNAESVNAESVNAESVNAEGANAEGAMPKARGGREVHGTLRYDNRARLPSRPVFCLGASPRRSGPGSARRAFVQSIRSASAG